MTWWQIREVGKRRARSSTRATPRPVPTHCNAKAPRAARSSIERPELSALHICMLACMSGRAAGARCVKCARHPRKTTNTPERGEKVDSTESSSVSIRVAPHGYPRIEHLHCKASVLWPEREVSRYRWANRLHISRALNPRLLATRKIADMGRLAGAVVLMYVCPHARSFELAGPSYELHLKRQWRCL